MYSTHWIALPLRPASLLLSLSRERIGALAGLAAPVANLMDAVATRIPYRWRPRPQAGLQMEPLSSTKHSLLFRGSLWTMPCRARRMKSVVLDHDY